MTTSEQMPIECLVPGCHIQTARLATDDYARAKGWHIYRELNDNDDLGWKERAICPDHSGNQKRQPLPAHFEGEVPLW